MNRRRKKRRNMKKIEELDGYFEDTDISRTIHVTFEDRDVIIFDIYDNSEIKDTLRKDPIGIVELNLRNGKCRDRLKEEEVDETTDED